MLEGLAGMAADFGEIGEDSLTGVVTVTDDGGSSGRLRKQFGVLPPGDVRNCLVALAHRDSPFKPLLQHRFDDESGQDGHAVGNLLLTALAQISGDFTQAIDQLGIDDRVTRARHAHDDSERAAARGTRSGQMLTGETEIVGQRSPIRRLSLDPSPRPLPHVLRALVNAEGIVVGPGSLYTSVLPNLLVEGVAATIYGVNAVRIYVANLMTEPGETDGYTLDDHLRVIRSHTGFDLFDYILVNRRPIDEVAARRYADQGSEPVVADRVLQHAGRAQIVECDLAIEWGGTKIRHHPPSLARAIRALIKAGRPPEHSHARESSRSRRPSMLRADRAWRVRRVELGPSPPQSPGPGSGDVIQVSGRERFGWTQVADDIAHFSFRGLRRRQSRRAAADRLSASTSSAFRLRLPSPLAPGRHTLEVVSVVTAVGQMVESPRAPAAQCERDGHHPIIESAGVAGLARSGSAIVSLDTCRLRSCACLGAGICLLGRLRNNSRGRSKFRCVPRRRVEACGSRVVEARRPHSAPEVRRESMGLSHRARRDRRRGATAFADIAKWRTCLASGRCCSRSLWIRCPRRTSASFGPDGYLSIGLLSSGQGQNRIGIDRFLLRLTDAGTAAPGNLNGSPFANLSGPAPVALARDTDGGAPMGPDAASGPRLRVTRLGEPTSKGDRLDPASAPVAMQIGMTSHQQVLYITGTRGDVRRLARDRAGWSLRDGFGSSTMRGRFATRW